ncbi:hypothetical protein Cob_v013020 [Colletotrichum orbiculare MAFF 240422]|uniref:Uncharacterized protein n=1 Tax=Colletotrichum orbiculare (strain 104-T / ATCC 96160 / CBS 514.97 / LARS 414 / MAFF 240422) TaxID=1213857 RepID=N4UTJ7_COLOR|nr:hypothetical protein Cob_v013020 [Colletotrichum orbiculare MAFF 240422]
MFGILGAVSVDSNTKTYSTFEELFAALKVRMQKDGYKVVKSRTHRNKVGGTYEKGSEVVRCDLVCDRGGQPYKCTATQLKTTTKKTDCPWKAKAVNRKTMGAWLLTIICDEHNHEPRTPDPPTDEEDADAEGDADVQETPALPEAEPSLSTPDPSTSVAMAVAGVSSTNMRLTGDTFHNFKAEYRKMPKPERYGVLAQLQLRIAALYAIENEDLQRQERQARQERKHQEIEDGRRKSQSAQQTTQMPQAQPQPQQQPQQAQVQTQHHQQTPQQHQQTHRQQHPSHQQHPQAQAHAQAQNHNLNLNHNHAHTHAHAQGHNHSRAQQQMSQMTRDGMGMGKHPFEQSGHDEHAQYRDRQSEVNDRHQSFMGMARQHMGNAVQQTPIQQTPIPVPQFGMQSTPGSNATPVFRHYNGAPANSAGQAGGGTPTSAQQKRRGRPKKTGMDQQNLDASMHMGR